MVPVDDPVFGKRLVKMAEDLDEPTLMQIARFTSAEYYRVTSAKKFKEIYDRIDRLENEIEEKTIAFIVRNQPVAGDLRLIVMATKIGTDLERMADLAVDIAERTLELAGQPLIKPLIDIPKLAHLAQKMTRESIESFITMDGELARNVRTQDDEADSLRNLITRELAEIINRDCSVAARAIPLILVARHLERICDHATNIAESVVYVAEAKLIKHDEP